MKKFTKFKKWLIIVFYWIKIYLIYKKIKIQTFNMIVSKQSLTKQID